MAFFNKKVGILNPLNLINYSTNQLNQHLLNPKPQILYGHKISRHPHNNLQSKIQNPKSF